MKPRWTALVVAILSASVIAQLGVRMAGPDLGGSGQLPAVSYRANTNVPLAAISPGLILDTQGKAVVGSIVMAKNAAGTIVGAGVSDGDGFFELVTPVDGPLFLDVMGTPVNSVPFDPGSPIVIVLP